MGQKRGLTSQESFNRVYRWLSNVHNVVKMDVYRACMMAALPALSFS